jgi:hypothetical protein
LGERIISELDQKLTVILFAPNPYQHWVLGLYLAFSTS